MHSLRKVLSRLVSTRSDESLYETLPSSVERPKTPPSFGALPSFGDVSALQPLGVAPHGTRRDWLLIDSMGNATYLQVSPSSVSFTSGPSWPLLVSTISVKGPANFSHPETHACDSHSSRVGACCFSSTLQSCYENKRKHCKLQPDKPT